MEKRLPPGFMEIGRLAGRARYGFDSDADGKCEWKEAHPPHSDSLESTWEIHPPKEDARQASNQRDWLQTLRKEHDWEALATAAGGGKRTGSGVSKRTWEGWEQGRKMPYFSAVRLLRFVWELQLAAKIKEAIEERQGVD